MTQQMDAQRLKPNDLRHAVIVAAGPQYLIVRLFDGQYATVKYDLSSLTVNERGDHH